MPLSAGTTLGPYQIQAPLGAGGMGEVYKASDTRLDRTVAIKVLPEHVAADPDLKQRFEREARTVAALNHPHICTLHDIGNQDGIDFLVMEYLDGETLAQRLEKGALPLDQALQIAIQIADALDKAHRQGIVHRDLKPGNIMLTQAGAKLLDFGLAKLKPVGGEVGVSGLPTQEAPLTQQGAILGTIQYMAPEQLEGQEADARTDIFAFGALVYEMAAGKRPLDGKSPASLIAAIINVDPQPLAEVQPLAPAPLDRLVARCLAKDPESRWQSARDVLLDLRWIASGTGVEDGEAHARAVPHRTWLRPAALGIAGAIGLLGGALLVVTLRQPSAPQSVHLPVPIAGLAVTNHAPGSAVALSPDGTTLVYVSGGDGSGQLYVRDLQEFQPQTIPGAEEAHSPFFSPDGEWVAFVSGTNLMKVRLDGTQVTRIAADASAIHGGDWGPDGRIVFGAADGLWSVSAQGGEPELLLSPDPESGEVFLTWPSFLPDGNGVLFTGIRAGAAQRGVEAVNVSVFLFESAERTRLFPGGGNAHYLPTGQLVHAADGRLYVTPFDLERLAVTGPSLPVAQDLQMGLPGEEALAHYAVSDSGTLVYLPGDATYDAGFGVERELVWVDRDGREEPIQLESHVWEYPRISPDGSRVVISASDGGHDLWLWHLDRDTLSPLTFAPEIDSDPVWTTDSRVVFSSRRAGGPPNVYTKAADGTGQVDRLSDAPLSHAPSAITPDGRSVLLTTIAARTTLDLHLLSLEAPNEMEPLLVDRGNQLGGVVSPNGRWLAYASTLEGAIYVVPYPNVSDGLWLATGDTGGVWPLFGPDGRELFYLNEGRLVAVTIEDGPSPSPGRPRVVAEGPYFSPPWESGIRNRTYDITPDGARLLMVKAIGGVDRVQSPTELHLVFNWFEELTQRVPVD